MPMIMAPVLSVADDEFISTTAVSETHPEWDAGTSYDAGDRVIVADRNRIYESAQDGNTGNDPRTDGGANTDPPTWWIMIGATNPWAALDFSAANASTGTGSLEWVIEPAERVQVVGLFKVQAQAVSVTATLGSATKAVTATMVDYGGITDWHTWTFVGPRPLTRHVFTDVPWFGPGTRYTITADAGAGNDVSLGEIAMGPRIQIGNAAWGTRLTRASGSVWTFDKYQQGTVTPGFKRRRMTAQVKVIQADLNYVLDQLDAYDDTPCMFIANSDASLAQIVLGVFVDYEATVVLPTYQIYSLQVQDIR